jgi:hypothetical protein
LVDQAWNKEMFTLNISTFADFFNTIHFLVEPTQLDRVDKKLNPVYTLTFRLKRTKGTLTLRKNA